MGGLVTQRRWLPEGVVVGPGENSYLRDSKIYWKEEKGVMWGVYMGCFFFKSMHLSLTRTVGVTML